MDNKNKPISTRLELGIPLIEKIALPLFPVILIAIILNTLRCYYFIHDDTIWPFAQYIVFAAIYTAYFLRNRLKPEVRLSVYCGSILVQGFVGLMLWGFLGQGFILIVSALILATVAGFRYWLIFSSITLFFISLVGTGFVLGILQIHADPIALLHSPIPWILAIFTCAIISCAAFLWDRLFQELDLRTSQLAESRNNYQEIFNSTSDAISLHDADTGLLIDVNNTGLEMYLYTREEMTGKSVADFSDDAAVYSQEKVMSRINSARQGGIQIFEWTGRRSDGTIFPIEVSLKKVNIGGKERIMSSVRDITQRKKTELERERLKEQLRQSQKMESIGQLAGGIAHDFNNILQAIKGFTEIGMLETSEEHPAYRRMKDISTASDRASRLVSQLLAFSRRQVMKMESIDLNEVTAGMIKMLGRIISKNIRLDFNPGHEIRTIIADRGMMEQVLMNLCVNARDAMPNGGTIVIETAGVDIDEDFCKLNTWAKPGRYVLLSVSDSGVGMDEKTQSHLFEPFFSTKEVGKGTGLGLATVYGIVTQHNGIIKCQSAPDKGSVFKVYIPATMETMNEI